MRPPPRPSIARHHRARRVQQRACIEVEQEVPGRIGRLDAPARPCGSRRPGCTARRCGRSGRAPRRRRPAPARASSRFGGANSIVCASAPKARSQAVARQVDQHQVRALACAKAAATARPRLPAAPVIITVRCGLAHVTAPVACRADSGRCRGDSTRSLSSTCAGLELRQAFDALVQRREVDVRQLEQFVQVLDARSRSPGSRRCGSACASRVRGRSAMRFGEASSSANTLSVADEAMPAP